ncbi:tyrosinase family protein [Acinetobacter sp. 194]|uniref:tyrosinase family protein n=1 Tax=Acinetobacter shaoyimingii TaxID=2715164 RepID=UPI00140D3FA0|nr:tyrosinase family protein [Acinetobacter shaoyimingii]NHB58651.1 tyrosinase family protein [Acinetobacter shaoyimingii]
MKKGIAKLVILASTCGILSISTYAQKIPSLETYVKDLKNLNALNQGFAEMRKANFAEPNTAKYRTSLNYWANIHGYFGYDKKSENLQEYYEELIKQCYDKAKGEPERKACGFYQNYYASLNNQTAGNDKIAQEVWGTCEHGTEFFLPWHRLYLHYFEKTLRKASGNPNLQLPYWKYEDNIDNNNLLFLPWLFTQNYLSAFDIKRTIGLNENKIGIKVRGDNKTIDITGFEALQAVDFYRDDKAGFSNLIESNPHNLMHCAVGANCYAPNMGLVPAAGNDPIFYLHHRNIDRLWQKWMLKKAKGQKIDLAWAKANLGMPATWFEKEMKFVDENGNLVSRKVADAFNSEFMPDYDDLGLKSDPTLLASESKLLMSPLGHHENIEISNINVLGAQVSRANFKDLPVNNMLRSTGPAISYLTIQNIELVNKPMLTYAVYMVSKKDTSKRSYLTTFSFFGLNNAHAHHGKSKIGDMKLIVSDNLQEIGAQSLADFELIFEPTDFTSNPVFTQLSKDGLKIGKILLTSEPIS